MYCPHLQVKVVKGPACSSRAVDTPGAAAPSDARTAGGLLMHLQACHNQQQQEQQPQLCFVDLAGCERVKRTGNSGARLRWAGLWKRGGSGAAAAAGGLKTCWARVASCGATHDCSATAQGRTADLAITYCQAHPCYCW
jgi:hypothetical protein